LREVQLPCGKRLLCFKCREQPLPMWARRISNHKGTKTPSMKDTIRNIVLLVLAGAVVLLITPGSSRAHMVSASGVAPQNIVTHADATIFASAPPTPALAANPERVTAICQNNGATNDARAGDANIGASQGARMQPGQGVTFDTTAAVYVYSQSGTVVGCQEVLRP